LASANSAVGREIALENERTWAETPLNPQYLGTPWPIGITLKIQLKGQFLPDLMYTRLSLDFPCITRNFSWFDRITV